MAFTLPARNIKDGAVRACLIALERYLARKPTEIELAGGCKLWFDADANALKSEHDGVEKVVSQW